MIRGAPFTVDANVLVYCFQAGDRRQVAAVDLMERAIGSGCILALQALGDFFHVATRKRPLARSDAALQVRRWRAACSVLVAASSAALDAALPIAEAGRLSYWDALLLATAAEAGCDALISEDMAPGAALGGCRVVPAFAPGGAIAAEALALLGGDP